MGLPQELVDQIVDMLRDDLRALKACSLTCKAMFASTRHLIHQRLCLTERNSRSVLTQEEEQQLYQSLGNYPSLKLRLLPYAGERGLLQYTRHVHIGKGYMFTPDTLLPHLHHFQSLDHVHTLTIEHYNPPSWADHYNTCFVHFYPTLTSLTLSYPHSRYGPLLEFALQFPNLENLCLEWLPIKEGHIPYPAPTAPIIFEQWPPLRGHLRLAGYGTTSHEQLAFARLPNGFNFRTVELEAFFGDRVQYTLNACADTLEDLTIIPLGYGKHLPPLLSLTMMNQSVGFLSTGDVQLRGFGLQRMTLLCRLTLRMAFRQVSTLRKDALSGLLSTITSLVFSEFVLEIGRLPPHFHGSTSEFWGSWEEVDAHLKTRFARYGGFKLIIRTGKLIDRGDFERHVRGSFPLLENMGRIQFETDEYIEKYWHP